MKFQILKLKNILADLAIRAGTSYCKENIIQAFIADGHLINAVVGMRTEKYPYEAAGADVKALVAESAPKLHKAICDAGFTLLKDNNAKTTDVSNCYFLEGLSIGNVVIMLSVTPLGVSEFDSMSNLSAERLQEYDDIINAVAKDAKFSLDDNVGYFVSISHISPANFMVEFTRHGEYPKYISIEPPYEFTNPLSYPVLLEGKSQNMVDRTMLAANYVVFGICNEMKRIYTKRFGRFKVRFQVELNHMV